MKLVNTISLLLLVVVIAFIALFGLKLLPSLDPEKATEWAAVSIMSFPFLLAAACAIRADADPFYKHNPLDTHMNYHDEKRNR